MPFKLTPDDPDYGELLRNIPDRPPVLWGEGESRLLAEGNRIAIVGSRRSTAYGRRVAFRLAVDLAEAGVVVVSGLAFGIDAEAHRGALAGGGKTIAVLGCGLDVRYPAMHEGLRRKIEGQGAVITEFPNGTTPAPWNFPRRNRIISGLSHGVVVVEAAEDSGSLITARWAADQGREVFAVPGPVDSRTSVGTNRLIQQGAKLVTRLEDILEEIPHESRPKTETESSNLSETEAEVLELLADSPTPMEVIIARSGLAVDRVASVIVDLEISGRVRALPGGLFERV